MERITSMQIYSLLVMTTAPLAYLITPMVTIHLAEQYAYLAILLSIIPGAMLIHIYSYIIRKSNQPFPGVLEFVLGKIAGKIIGFTYILVFLFGTAFTLSYFVYLISSSIVPDTPLSVYIGAMLLTGYYALKTGLQNIARVAEVLFIAALPVGLLLIVAGLLQNPTVSNILPLLPSNYRALGTASFHSFFVVGDMIAILVLAYYAMDRRKLTKTLYQVLFTYVGLTAFIALGIIINFGPVMANLVSFPTFKLIRGITLGDFLQNIDVVFIGIWIIAIFGSIMVKWFLLCHTIQSVFGLQDYRFLAAPSSVIIGLSSLMMAPNIIALQLIAHHLLPYLYSFFYVGIPVLLYLGLLLKNSTEPDVPLAG